jgi:hypothetical protein
LALAPQFGSLQISGKMSEVHHSALSQWRDFLAECLCRICHQPLGYECADGERKYFLDPDRPAGYVHGDCLAAKLLRLRYPRASLVSPSENCKSSEPRR